MLSVMPVITGPSCAVNPALTLSVLFVPMARIRRSCKPGRCKARVALGEAINAKRAGADGDIAPLVLLFLSMFGCPAQRVLGCGGDRSKQCATHNGGGEPARENSLP